MPAVSEQQRRAMCLAWSVKLGKRSPQSVSPEIRKMAESMTAKQLRDYCESKVEK